MDSIEAYLAEEFGEYLIPGRARDQFFLWGTFGIGKTPDYGTDRQKV